jgi:uncharacterized protein involved in exopolysaccharide biosynthesis
VTALPLGDGKPRATWTLSDPWSFLLLLAGHWKLLLLSALAGALALFVALFLVSPRYDINAKLLLQFGREMMAPPGVSAKDGAQVMPAAKRPEDIASEVEILSNPRLIRQVVEHFGEDFFFGEHPPETLWQHIKRIPKLIWRGLGDAARGGMVLIGLRPQTTPLDRAVLAIGAALQVEAVRKSDVIEIKLGYPDPHVGILLLNKYLEYAAESHMQAHRAPAVREFFAAERETRSRELRQAEERLLAVRAERAAAWSAPEQRTLLLKAEADLLQQHAVALADAAQAMAEIARAKAMIETLPSEEKLSANEAPERDLLAKQNLLQGHRARATQISAQLQRLRMQLQASQASEIEISELERTVARLRRNLDLYEKGLEDARIAEAMDLAQLSNLKVIMPPTADIVPSYPPVRLFLILGIVGGLTLAIGFIVARELLRGMRRDQRDVAEVIEGTRVPPSVVSARHG